MCKLDIENAFDYLNWSYLMIILKKIGFEDKWIKWIRFSILTMNYLVSLQWTCEFLLGSLSYQAERTTLAFLV
uniref:Putative ovule protein n=1 Tax=Solanum chacoense TaxID=4108 RepID=A0A0V0GXL2_SOLCH